MLLLGPKVLLFLTALIVPSGESLPAIFSPDNASSWGSVELQVRGREGGGTGSRGACYRVLESLFKKSTDLCLKSRGWDETRDDLRLGKYPESYEYKIRTNAH